MLHYIIKSILRKSINIERVCYRDTAKYFGILLDDSIRKPICRLWLNGEKKSIVIFDDQKNEILYEINSINDIYNYSDQIIQRALSYDERKDKVQSEFDTVAVSIADK